MSWQEIFKERAKMYAQADITVNINDDITVDQVALRVLTELKSRLEEDDVRGVSHLRVWLSLGPIVWVVVAPKSIAAERHAEW